MIVFESMIICHTNSDGRADADVEHIDERGDGVHHLMRSQSRGSIPSLAAPTQHQRGSSKGSQLETHLHTDRPAQFVELHDARPRHFGFLPILHIIFVSLCAEDNKEEEHHHQQTARRRSVSCTFDAHFGDVERVVAEDEEPVEQDVPDIACQQNPH